MSVQLPGHELLETLLSDPAEPVIGYDLDGTVILWNRAACLFYGYSSEEMLGHSIKSLLPLHELPVLDHLLCTPSAASSLGEVHVERLSKEGLLLRFPMRRSLLRGPQGEPVGFLERAYFDSSSAINASAETHLRFLVEKMPLSFWTTDRALRVTSHWASRVATAGAGFAANPVGLPIQNFIGCSEASQSPVKEHFLALQGISSRFEYARNKRLYDVSIEPYRGPQGGGIQGCIGMALDITERRKSEDEIRYRASHDGLTGLANYRDFHESLEREVRRAGRTGQRFALLLLDLDDLKKINDRFGHMVGNRSLKRLAGVMKDHCRATELAARFGGDEFAILLLDADRARGQTVAERIRTCLRQQPHPPPLSVSIGFAVFPEDGPAAADLLEIADKRLYQDKRSRAHRDVPPVAQQS